MHRNECMYIDWIPLRSHTTGVHQSLVDHHTYSLIMDVASMLCVTMATSPLVLDVVYVASMVHCVYWYTVVEGRNQIHTNYCTVRIAIECVLVLWIHGYDLPTSGSQDTS